MAHAARFKTSICNILSIHLRLDEPEAPEKPTEDPEELPRKRKPPVEVESGEILATPSAATPVSEPPAKVTKVEETNETTKVDGPQETRETAEASATPAEETPPPPAEVKQTFVPTEEPPASQPRPEEFWQDRQEFEDSPATMTRHDSQGTLL